MLYSIFLPTPGSSFGICAANPLGGAPHRFRCATTESMRCNLLVTNYELGIMNSYRGGEHCLRSFGGCSAPNDIPTLTTFKNLLVGRLRPASGPLLTRRTLRRWIASIYWGRADDHASETLFRSEAGPEGPAYRRTLVASNAIPTRNAIMAGFLLAAVIPLVGAARRRGGALGDS